jgi:hypothetical protein
VDDSIALAAAHFSSLAIRTIGLLAASLLVLQSLYLVAFTIYITRKPPRDKRQ